MSTLTLKNAKLVLADEIFEGGLVIEEGKIKSITKDPGEEGDVVDLKGRYVLPGLVDVHVHMREPGSSSKEDWVTGSCAAAAGGVTTVLDMPNTQPSTTTLECLEAKRKLVSGKSKVDYGFHFGASLGNMGELQKIGSDVASVKVYMSATTGNLKADNDAIVYEELRMLGAKGVLVSTHAENRDMVDFWHSVLAEKENPSALDYADSRPNICAATALNQMAYMSRMAHNHIHFCHISTKEEVDLLREIKHPGITCEVTPHHLFLSRDDIERLGNSSKVNPPLRSQEDQEALWRALSDGLVDVIATDHAPHLPEEKERPILQASAGFPGLETLLPLLLDAVNKERLDLLKVAELTATNPARIFSIKNKGEIKEGFDADLVVVDMDLEKPVEEEKLKTKCKWSPFSGLRLKGWPIQTYLRGKRICDSGLVMESEGREISYFL